MAAESTSPKTVRPAKPTAWAQTLRILALLAILGAQPVFQAIDPLDFSTATQEVSARVAARVIAPFYNYDAEAPDNIAPASREIAVVMLYDEDVAEFGGVFPLPYPQQMKLYSSILRYEPRVLFLDLLYVYDRGGLSTFAERMATMSSRRTVAAQAGVSETGVVVGLAGAAVKWSSQETLPVVREAFDTGIVGFTNLGEVYELSNGVRESVVGDEPLYYTDRVDPWPDQRATAPTTVDGEALRQWPSAAVRVMQIACATDAALPPERRKNYPGCAGLQEILNEPLSQPMSIYWGGLPSVVWEPKSDAPTDLGEIAETTGCSVFDPSFDGRLGESVGRAMSSFRLLDHPGDDVWCAPLLWIPARYLVTGGAEMQRYLREVLHDKLVMFGVSVVGADDRKSFYEHNAPGVMMHAMALDNLLNYGGAFFKEPDPVTKVFGSETVFGYPVADLGLTEAFWVDIGTLALLLLMSFLLRPVLAGVAELITSRPGLQDSLVVTLWIIMACFVSAVIVSLTFTFLRWPPHNWIGVIAFAGVAFQLSKRFQDTLSASMKGGQAASGEGKEVELEVELEHAREQEQPSKP